MTIVDGETRVCSAEGLKGLIVKVMFKLASDKDWYLVEELKTGYYYAVTESELT